MIDLYILLGLILLLLLPLHGRFSYEGEGRFTLRYAGIPVYRYVTGQKDKPKKSKKADKPQTKKKKKENPVKKLTGQLKGQGAAGIVGFIGELVRLLRKSSRWLVRCLHIRRFTAEIAVAGNDAAATAERYGALCAPVAAAQTLALHTLRIRRLDVDMRPDFNREKDAVWVDIRVVALPLALLWTGIRVLFSWLGMMIRMNNESEDKKNG
ncbi:MAG: hypothetical protein J6R77_02475 [Clostridia bacterium]|nr:hypothetical protein [Clostridia bacterium]